MKREEWIFVPIDRGIRNVLEFPEAPILPKPLLLNTRKYNPYIPIAIWTPQVGDLVMIIPPPIGGGRVGVRRC